MIKLFGAIMIVCGCAGAGFMAAHNHIKQEKLVLQIILAIDAISSELRYKLTPLPDLCDSAARRVNGSLRNLFSELADELRKRYEPDVLSCMRKVLYKSSLPVGAVREIMIELGLTLGIYDLEGQEKGLKRVQEICIAQLDNIRAESKERVRCYKTLGLCAGTALAILFV